MIEVASIVSLLVAALAAGAESVVDRWMHMSAEAGLLLWIAMFLAMRFGRN